MSGEMGMLPEEDRVSFAPRHREMMARLRRPVPREPGARDGAEAAAFEPPPAICFAPGTDRALIDAMNGAAWEGFHRRIGDDAFAVMAFQLSSRWSRTALSRPPGGRFASFDQGDPVTLTWGFLPDGTSIPGGSQGSGEAAGPSDLVAWMNDWFGSNPSSALPEDQPWFPIFESVFARWSELIGVDYVYEPNDDGAAFPSSSGIAGVRPDIRIGGHRIDGTGSTLAYNYFPDRGDMVIDTDDGYLESRTSNALRLRNVVAHEHGHGLGLQHVCPLDSSKLMEPRITTLFDGPQFDDIYSANRHYGDPLEDTDGDPDSDRNDSDASATDLGTLPFGTTAFEHLSIDDNNDADHLAFRLPASDARIGITVRPVGQTYREAAQSSDGTCPNGTLFDAAIVHDLRFDLLAGDGSTVIASFDESPAGDPESVARFSLPPGTGPYILRIRGGSANNAQLYQLDVVVEPDSVPVATVADIEVGEDDGQATFTVTLDRPTVVPAAIEYALVAGSAEAGADFEPASGVVDLGVGVTAASVTVEIIDDASDENDERFSLTLRNPSLVTLGNVSATATIADDDPEPVITVQPIDMAETNPVLPLLGRLSQASGKPVSVPYELIGGTATAGEDFTAASGTLEFAVGETTSLKPIGLLDDALDEDDETVRVVFGTPVNAASAEDNLLVILDDDPLPALSIGGADAAEADGQLVFTVSLNAPSGRDVVYDWVATGLDVEPGIDFTPTGGTLVIPAGETEASIVLALTDDGDPERNESVEIVFVDGSTAVPPSDGPSLIILDEDAGRLLDETVRLDLPPGTTGAVIRWSAVAGRPYRILGSDDLFSWSDVFPGGDFVPDSSEAEVSLPPVDDGLPARRFIRVIDPGRPPEAP